MSTENVGPGTANCPQYALVNAALDQTANDIAALLQEIQMIAAATKLVSLNMDIEAARNTASPGRTAAFAQELRSVFTQAMTAQKVAKETLSKIKKVLASSDIIKGCPRVPEQ